MNKHRTGKWWTISSGLVNYNKIRPDLRKSVAQPLYQSLTHQSSEARVEVSVLSSHYSMTSIAIFTLNIIITKKYICRIQEFRRLYLMATCWLSQTSKWIVWTYLYFEQKEEKGVSFVRTWRFHFQTFLWNFFCTKDRSWLIELWNEYLGRREAAAKASLVLKLATKLYRDKIASLDR